MMCRFAAALTVAAGLGGCAAGPGASGIEGADATAAFDKIKGLAGEWNGTGTHEEPAQAGTRFEVTSAGSAVKETMFPGSAHEMVNMYTMDRGSLVMTHYCAMGNQPHLRLTGVDGNVYRFEFVRGGNLASRDEAHMDSMILTLDGPDHITSVWTSWADGAPTGDNASFDLRRLKSNAAR